MSYHHYNLPTSMTIQHWGDFDVRFVEVDGEWFAVLKDICDALDLDSWKVADRIDPDTQIKARIDVCDRTLTAATSRRRNTQDMICVSEADVYMALFRSRRLEAKQFTRWATDILRRLRQLSGYRGYQILDLPESDLADRLCLEERSK